MAFAAICVLVAASLIHARAFFHDDAYITFRYVERLLAGKGLSWSDGPPVEGFTHPAWLAQLVALGTLHIDLEAASKVLGIGYLVAILALWWRSRIWVLPLAVVAALPGTSLWAVGGLETMGFVFWLLLGGRFAARSIRDRGAATPLAVAGGLALAVAALHRPDGVGFAALASIVLAGSGHARQAKVLGAASAAPLLAYLAFRFWMFGALQATSAAAKIEAIPLRFQASSFAEYAWDSALEWAPGALAASFVLLWRPTREAVVLFLLGVAALVPAFLGGGDHMVGARLLVPAVAVLSFGCALRWDDRRPPRGVQAALVLAAAVHGFHLTSPPPGRDPAAVWGRVMGEFLEHHLPPGALVAAATAGSTPYFSPDLDYIDTLGLNDRHIAAREITEIHTEWQSMPGHRKGDGAYVLARQPDVIVRGGAAGDNEVTFLTDHELDRSAAFRGQYRPYAFSAPAPRLGDLDAAHAPPPEALRSGRALLVAWLRNDSPRVEGLRAAALDPPPARVLAARAALPEAPEPARAPPTVVVPPPAAAAIPSVVPADLAPAPVPHPPSALPASIGRPASSLKALVACSGREGTVDFHWQAPDGQKALFLDVGAAGANPIGHDVTGRAAYRLTLSPGVYAWRVNALFDRWHPTEWQALIVEECGVSNGSTGAAAIVDAAAR